MGNKRSRQRRANAMARPLPPFHPTPIFAAVCMEHGTVYSPTYPPFYDPTFANQWYGQPGWPPHPYWLSEAGNWYVWHEGDERYYPSDMPEDLPLRILDALGVSESAPVRRAVRHSEGWRPNTTTLYTILDAPAGWRLGPAEVPDFAQLAEVLHDPAAQALIERMYPTPDEG